MKAKGTILATAGIVLIGAMLLTDRCLKKLPDPVVIAVSVIAFLLLLSGMILLRKH